MMMDSELGPKPWTPGTVRQGFGSLRSVRCRCQVHPSQLLRGSQQSLAEQCLTVRNPRLRAWQTNRTNKASAWLDSSSRSISCRACLPAMSLLGHWQPLSFARSTAVYLPISSRALRRTRQQHWSAGLMHSIQPQSVPCRSQALSDNMGFGDALRGLVNQGRHEEHQTESTDVVTDGVKQQTGKLPTLLSAPCCISLVDMWCCLCMTC